MAASEEHAHAAALIEGGREEEAFAVVQGLLRRERDDAEALWLLGNLHAKAEQYTSAWLAFRRAAELRPQHHQILNNVGMALEGLGHTSEARSWFERALKHRPGYPNYLANVGMTYLLDGDVRLAEKFASQAIAGAPEHVAAHTCRAFALLSQGSWAEGWDDYTYAQGTKFRAVQDYGLPVWQGQPDAHVVVCAEQGVGDEVMYGTCIPDLLRSARAVTLDCDRRTVKMFRRSFPAVSVQGTRAQRDKPWLDPAVHTHQIMAGELPKYFRRSAQSFPDLGRFLKPDEDLLAMYGALVARHAGGRLRVGLTMTGGGYHTGRKRQLDVRDFAPLVERFSGECAFFSLEYRADAAERIVQSGLPISHFHYAVGQGADYDQTLALIANLDLVVGVHTTAHHAAGGLALPTLTLVPSKPSWIYGQAHGSRLPWYGSVELFRQRQSESWAQTVRRLADEAAARFRRS